MPPSRLCNLTVEWVRGLCSGAEDGDEAWRQFEASITDPDQAGSLTGGGGSGDAAEGAVAARSKADRMQAQAEARVGDEGAAFMSFMGSKAV